MIFKITNGRDGPRFLACDAQCHKAWGVSSRPKLHVSDPGLDPDDTVMLSDAELGDAPVNPGTSEGGVRKPTRHADRLNKWCARECERSVWLVTSDIPERLRRLPNFKNRTYNKLETRERMRLEDAKRRIRERKAQYSNLDRAALAASTALARLPDINAGVDEEERKAVVEAKRAACQKREEALNRAIATVNFNCDYPDDTVDILADVQEPGTFVLVMPWGRYKVDLRDFHTDPDGSNVHFSRMPDLAVVVGEGVTETRISLWDLIPMDDFLC